MKEAFIVAAARTPVGKAPNGKIRTVRPDDLAALAIKGALARVPSLLPNEIEDVIIAGGAESMSYVPMGGFKLSPNPCLLNDMPDAYLGMGYTAENVANKFNVSREDADMFAYQSHQKAIAAIDAGRFKEECVSVPLHDVNLNDQGKLKSS